jgi:hypothetical protein
MYRLTERRFAKAKPILDKYRKQVHDAGRGAASGLERELRECWDIGYQELKDIIIDLSKRPHYRYLAASYMESGYPSVVSEFHRVLADMYGIKSFHHSAERESKREEFWSALKTKN